MGKKSKKKQKQKLTAKSRRQVQRNNADLGVPKVVTAVAAISEVAGATEAVDSYPVVRVEAPKSSNAEELKQGTGEKRQNKKFATVDKSKADNVNKSEIQDNVCSVLQTAVKPDTNVQENTIATYPVDLAETSKVSEAPMKEVAVVRMEESPSSIKTEKNDDGKKKRNKNKKAGQAGKVQMEVQSMTCQKEDLPKLDTVTAKRDVNSGSQIQQETIESAISNSRDKLKQAVEVTSEQDNKIDATVSVPVSKGDKPNIIEEEKVQKRQYTRSFLLDILKTAKLVRPQLLCPELAVVTPRKQPVVFERPPQSLLSRINRPIDSSQKRAIPGIANKRVVLHKSSASWQSTRNKASKDEVDSLVQKLRGFLNKLSPKNFDKILSDIKGISFDTLAKLVGFVKVLFEKALLEPKFSQTYALLASRLLNLSVKEGDKTVDFKTLLIRECQKEFEKDKTGVKKILREMAEKIRVAKTDVEKNLLKEEETAHLMTKKRSITNVKFIGELFKVKVLSEAIMHTCFDKLMQQPEDEECMECVCQLLSTIGEIMDSKSKAKIDDLINQLDRLVAENKTSSRIRFLIMNVIDLRKSGWIPKTTKVPTTIGQVNRTAETEKQRSMTYDKRRPVRKSDTLESTAGPYQAIMPGSNQRLSQDVMALNVKQGNDISKAKNEGADIKKPKTYGKKSSKFEGLKILCVDKDEVKSFENKERVELEGHLATSSTALDQKVLSRRKMELKVKSKINEFLSLKAMNEALESIKELNTEACYTNAVRFFYISFSQNFAGSSEVRNQIGQLHRNILEKKIAPIEAYVDAAIRFSTFASGMVIDIPQIWTYISELVTPVVVDSELIKIDAFVKVSTSADAELDEELSVGEGDYTAMLLAAIMNGVSSCKGKEAAEQLWAEAGLTWESLLKHITVEEFRRNYLRF